MAELEEEVCEIDSVEKIETVRVIEKETVKVIEKETFKSTENETLIVTTEGENDTFKVTENETCKVTESETYKVTENETIKVTESDTFKVSGNENLKVSENESYKFTENEKHKVTENETFYFEENAMKDTRRVHHSFYDRYKELCRLSETSKSPCVKVRERRLLILGDSIQLKDWKPLLKALSDDSSLHCVIVQGRLPLQKFDYEAETEVDTRQVKHPFFTSYIMKSLFFSLKKCISNSTSLTYLTLQKIPMKGDLLTTLCEVVKSSNTLQHLAVQMTDMGDDGCQKLCRMLYNKSNLVTLDLSDCQIGCSGAFYIAQLLKHQELNRNLEEWKHNLRDRCADDEYFPGLRRVTINHNSILDAGLADIIHVLLDDKWIKAIDMQDCGISDIGAELVKKLLEENPLIVVFDIRTNKIQPELLFNVFQLLDGRATEEDNRNFGWMERSTLEQVMGSKKLYSVFDKFTSTKFPQYKNSNIEPDNLPEYKNSQIDVSRKCSGDEKSVTINKRKGRVDKEQSYLSESSEMSDIEEVLSPNTETSENEDERSENKSKHSDAPEKQTKVQPSKFNIKSCENVNMNYGKRNFYNCVRMTKSSLGLGQRHSKQEVSFYGRSTKLNPRQKFTLSSNSTRLDFPGEVACGDYNRYERASRKKCEPPKHEETPPRNGFIPLYSHEGNPLIHLKPIDLNAMLPAKPPPLTKSKGKSTTYSQSYRNVCELAKNEKPKSRYFFKANTKTAAQKRFIPSSKPRPFL